MDHFIKRSEAELISLESALDTLAEVRSQLRAKKVTQSIALEADRLIGIGSGTVLNTYYSGQDHAIALEGVFASVWENIKAFFKKIGEYLKRFWNWITGQKEKTTEAKVDEVEKRAQEFHKNLDEMIRSWETASYKLKTTDAKGNTTTTSSKTVDGTTSKSTTVETGGGGGLAAKVSRLNEHAKRQDAEDAKLPLNERIDKSISKLHKPTPLGKGVKSHDVEDVSYTERGKDGSTSKHEHQDDPFTATRKQVEAHVKEAHAANDILDKALKGHTGNDEVQKRREETHARLRSADNKHDELLRRHKEFTGAGGDDHQRYIEAQRVGYEHTQENLRKHLEEGVRRSRFYGQENAQEKYDNLTKLLQTNVSDAKGLLDSAEQAHGGKSKPATEGIALEDAGVRPSEILNNVAEELKGHFVTSLSHTEKLVLFSAQYANELQKLAQEFARLKPVDALVFKYKTLDGLLNTALGEAARVDAVTGPMAYRDALAEFKNKLEGTLEYAMDREDGKKDDADQLSADIDRFHAARDGKGDFEIVEPKTGDQFFHIAATTDHTFRTLKDAQRMVDSALGEIKQLEQLFEGLSSRIGQMASGNQSGNHEARNMVAHYLQAEVKLISARIRMVVKGLGVFPLYHQDAHRAITRYQRLVITIAETALRQMHGEYEFREEQLKTVLDKLRDTHMQFSKLA